MLQPKTWAAELTASGRLRAVAVLGSNAELLPIRHAKLSQGSFFIHGSERSAQIVQDSVLGLAASACSSSRRKASPGELPHDALPLQPRPPGQSYYRNRRPLPAPRAPSNATGASCSGRRATLR
ncbi:hypothetical protein [Thiobacillus denitrificans]|uniref:hypothetical protein n=1 Tax=Thiobacillus denitrificans TaxID=36861 RepID=UPI0003817B4F|nr:hypothetical protein [Thiobacillus denitrificans]